VSENRVVVRWLALAAQRCEPCQQSVGRVNFISTCGLPIWY